MQARLRTERLRRAFDELDVDGNGRIDEREFQTLRAKLEGPEASDGLNFAAVSSDAEGLTFDQFSRWWAVRRSSPTRKAASATSVTKRMSKFDAAATGARRRTRQMSVPDMPLQAMSLAERMDAIQRRQRENEEEQVRLRQEKRREVEEVSQKADIGLSDLDSLIDSYGTDDEARRDSLAATKSHHTRRWPGGWAGERGETTGPLAPSTRG